MPGATGGLALHGWMTKTRTFQQMLGHGQGTTGIDDDLVARGFEKIGAWILGRNMFGPIRGDWPDEQWKGWWGDTPPYHTDVFVLTHHARAPIAMKGGTTFHFVTDGMRSALQRAKSSANGKDVRLGGGVGTVRRYPLAWLYVHAIREHARRDSLRTDQTAASWLRGESVPELIQPLSEPMARVWFAGGSAWAAC